MLIFFYHCTFDGQNDLIGRQRGWRKKWSRNEKVVNSPYLWLGMFWSNSVEVSRLLFPDYKIQTEGVHCIASIKKCFSQICWFTWLKVWCVFIGLKGATIDGKKSPGTRTRTHLVRLPDPTPRSEAATSSPTHLLLDIPGSWGTWLGGDSPGTAGFSPPASSTTS